jgi:L-ribulose-5-phosphate 3-epimerase
LRWGYNTNGLAHHRWDEALELIAEAGFQSVAITLDHHCLPPWSAAHQQELACVGALLDRLQLRCVIETGARFVLDPRRKHQPTLLSAEPSQRERRLGYLQYAVEVGAALNADAISFWSGTAEDEAGACAEPDHRVDDQVLWQRLIEGCQRLTETADRLDQRLAFEPEPGMFLERCDQFRQLHQAVNSNRFGLTLDVGHVHCLQDGVIADRIREFAPLLWNVHLEDMRPGRHEHLPLGTGDLPIDQVINALQSIDYQYGVHLELSRQSHEAPTLLRASREFLRPWWP